jgi:hypothetical protein
MQQVAFQLLAGSPFIARDAVVALPQQQLSGLKSVCFTANAKTAVIVTIIAGSSDISDVDVYFEPCQGFVDNYSDSYDPEVPAGDMTYADFRVETLAAGYTLVVDSVQRTVVVTDDAGHVVGGFDALSYLGAWRWMEASGGVSAEAHVDAGSGVVNGATTVRIETVEVA